MTYNPAAEILTMRNQSGQLCARLRNVPIAVPTITPLVVGTVQSTWPPTLFLHSSPPKPTPLRCSLRCPPFLPPRPGLQTLTHFVII